MIYLINGYWNDDNEKFSNLLVTDSEDVPAGYNDEDIFFFGITENELNGGGNLEFTIQNYESV